MREQRHHLFIGLAVLFLVLVLALGQRVYPPQAHAANGQGAAVTGQTVSVYNLDAQTATALRSSLSSGDTLTAAGAKATPKFTLAGGGARINVPVSIRFSTSGASVQIALASFAYLSDGSERLKDLSPTRTVTAGSLTDEDGLYVGPTVTLDSYAGSTARVVLMAAPSAGSVTVRVGSY